MSDLYIRGQEDPGTSDLYIRHQEDPDARNLCILSKRGKKNSGKVKNRFPGGEA